MPDFQTNETYVYHEHPIKILRYSAKNLWLLIFPLLRSLRFYPFSLQNLIDWGVGAWFDLLIALLILCFGTLRWYCCSYSFDKVSIHAKSGVFLKQETEIPFSRITATVEEHPIYLRPFRAVRLQISTASGVIPETNMQLILYLHDLHRMRPHVKALQNDSAKATPYHTPAWRVLFFSALFSSSFSGALYVAALFFQGGRITSDLLEEFQARQILEDAADRASSVFVGVPRVALIIGIVILVLWLISFGRNLLRYGRFRIRFGSEFLSVHMGILNRRRFHLRDAAIIFPDLRQNLVMKIFGMVSLHIRCPGYGGRRDTLPVLIPLMRKRASWNLLGKLHAAQRLEQPLVTARSKLRFFWSFLWPPVTGLMAVIVIRLFALWLIPDLSEIIRFFAIMLVLPLLWLLLVKVVTLLTQYVAMDEQHVQLHFSRGFTFHTITVRREHIVRTDLRQTPLQKRYGVCHFYLICNGPRQQRYKLTALPEETARAIIASLNHPIPPETGTAQVKTEPAVEM